MAMNRRSSRIGVKRGSTLHREQIEDALSVALLSSLNAESVRPSAKKCARGR
jgi:hypothetical protein